MKTPLYPSNAHLRSPRAQALLRRPRKQAMAPIALALSATLALALALPVTVDAATPPNMLVVANRIDDITTLDPAESFEFAGSDVNRNVYGKLVNFDPLDLDAGYQADLAESWEVSEDGPNHRVHDA